jgi:ribosomal protein S18 acetylase RimI-like enzyme
VGTSIIVRSAQHDDLGGINRVASETWVATYTGAIPDADIRTFLQSNYNRGSLEQSLATLGDGMLVAVDEDQVVGYAMLSCDRDGNAELWSIYVLPTRQGQGAGKQLWDAAIAHARSLSASRLALWVLESNTVARRFYERQGAVQVEQREFPVGNAGVSEVRYEIMLR